jgi:hypothetical protein
MGIVWNDYSDADGIAFVTNWIRPRTIAYLVSAGPVTATACVEPKYDQVAQSGPATRSALP